MIKSFNFQLSTFNFPPRLSFDSLAHRTSPPRTLLRRLAPPFRIQCLLSTKICFPPLWGGEGWGSRVCPAPEVGINTFLSLGGIYHRAYGGGDKDGAFFFRLVSFYYINSVNMLFLRLPCPVRSGQTDRLLSAGCQQRK